VDISAATCDRNLLDLILRFGRRFNFFRSFVCLFVLPVVDRPTELFFYAALRPARMAVSISYDTRRPFAGPLSWRTDRQRWLNEDERASGDGARKTVVV